MITRFKAHRVAGQLEELLQKALSRQDDTASNKYRDWYDYLNSVEQRKFSALATKHQMLCQKLGRYSAYFVKTRDPVKNDPDSPKGMVTVAYDKSDKVSYEYGEDGRLYKHVNGVKTWERGIDPEDFFGSRYTHPEHWEISNEELAERLWGTK